MSIAAALIDDTAGAVPEETLQLPEADSPENETHAADEAKTVDQNDRLSDEEHTLLPEADAVPLEQKIAELEELIGRSEGQWEPDGDEVESTTSEALPWADDAPSEDLKVHRAQPIVPPQTVDAAPEKPVQDGPDADALRAAVREALHDEVGAMEQDWSDIAQENLEMPTLDEDGLRDLVADIVRQELQGALGERITRNVRKLVRREIYRAMATNELD